ncbi:MAG TPA: YtxH domain-containing protein [Bryobacteraceae bacterium]|nr:YtxH domain-containing protein [Bryobacteraceae bacterium]
MDKDDRMIWFVAGLGIGAAGALLAAPASGRETRARLRDRAEAAGDYMKQRTEKLTESGAALISQGSQAVSETVARGRDVVSGLKEKIQGTYNEGSAAAKEATDAAVDKTRDLAHEAGRSMERGGKRLQEV